MPLTMNTSPPAPAQTVPAPPSKTMNTIPSSRLAAAASSTTRHEDATRSTDERQPKVPIVKLDVDTISDMMASSLASSLIGHVLFLKNQVPLPVLQLARLSNTKRNNNATDTRASKQRAELLTTYDTLASHLNTTFTALSTAFARCRLLDASSQATSNPGLASEYDNAAKEDGMGMSKKKAVLAYVAILVGPSIGSARSKILLGVDGLEARIWGEREDVNDRDRDHGKEDEDESGQGEKAENEEVDEDGNEEASEEEEDGDEEEEEEVEECAEEESEEYTSEEEHDEHEPTIEDEHGSDEDEATPPPSSPSLASNSPSPSPSPLPSPKFSPSSIPQLRPPPQSSPLRTAQQPYISHAQQQQTLLSAERLLSRTLALADADGCGFASDMTPTQTHILIRAPRRFSHPAWIPRHNVTATMEKALEEFLEESGIIPGGTGGGNPSTQNRVNGRIKGQKTVKKVEGVWVVGGRSAMGKDGTKMEAREERMIKEDERRDTDENDDMIWWSWDGKLVGFSDW